MTPIDPQDSMYLEAAQGWLDLGNDVEANEELERIDAKHRAHPDVLQVRWLVHAKAGKWDACLDIATALTQMLPERRFGWIHRAFSLHKMGRTQEAVDCLMAVIDRFETNATMPFYLALFYCRMGKIMDARQWLGKAFEHTVRKQERDKLKLKVLDEPDLEPLWKSIW